MGGVNISKKPSCPHTRGGEPVWGSDSPGGASVVPTHVGVNQFTYFGGKAVNFVVPTHVGVNRKGTLITT